MFTSPPTNIAKITDKVTADRRFDRSDQSRRAEAEPTGIGGWGTFREIPEIDAPKAMRNAHYASEDRHVLRLRPHAHGRGQ